MPRPTIRDVAQLASVDPSAVSRILNRSLKSHRYAADTIERVEAAARELAYRPSTTGRALRTGKTMTLGLVVQRIANPFYGELADRIQHHAAQRGYSLLVAGTGRSREQETEYFEELIARNVDGVILAPRWYGDVTPLVAAGTPLVTVDQQLPGGEVHHAGLDNHQAGRVLGEHLRSRGCRRVGVATLPHRHAVSLPRRLEGLREGLGDDAVIDPVLSTDGPATTDATLELMETWLACGGDLPEVFVGLNNSSTMGIARSLMSRRLRFPEDVGLVGVDDFPAAAIIGLTVVTQPIDQMARTALSLLLDASYRADGPRVRLLPGELVVRESVPQR